MVRNQFILDVHDEMIVERRPVPGYEGLYEVDNLGNVYSVERRVQTNGRGNKLIRARKLKPSPDPDGYLGVVLCRDNIRDPRKIHKLVLEAFVGPKPPGMVCRHADDVKHHNWLSNLSWGTHQQNSDDTAKSGVLKGENNPGHKLTEEQVREIRQLRSNGHTYRSIESRFGIGTGTITRIVKGTHWRHVW